MSGGAKLDDVLAKMRELGARAQADPPAERLNVLARGGALGLPIAAEHGGGGVDLTTTARAYEALGETLTDGGVLLAAGAHLFGVALTIAATGTDEQKRTWLPRLASGSVVATVAATEEAAGSDVSRVETVAEPNGQGYRVTGRKRFVTAAARAGLFLVIARSVRTSGLVALLVPRSAGAIEVGEPLDTAGLAGAGLAPVAWNGAEVDASAVLGREGAGMGVFQTAMTFERALVLAFRIGAMRRELDETVAFARGRVIGTTPIARHDSIAHRIARMKMRLETSRALVLRAAEALDRGERAHAEAALAKWHVAESAVASALDALHVRGGAGFLESSGRPSAVLDAIGGTIHSGTEDVLATIVARHLGL